MHSSRNIVPPFHLGFSVHMQTTAVGISHWNCSRPVCSVRRVGRTDGVEGHCRDRFVCAVLVHGQLRSWCRVRVRAHARRDRMNYLGRHMPCHARMFCY